MENEIRHTPEVVERVAAVYVAAGYPEIAQRFRELVESEEDPDGGSRPSA